MQCTARVTIYIDELSILEARHGQIIEVLLYGVFDALSQPLFSYAVKQIGEEHRARVLGGIDAIVLLSPSVGLFIGSWLAEGGVLLSGVFVCLIFVVCLLIVHRNPVLSSPKLERE